MTNANLPLGLVSPVGIPAGFTTQMYLGTAQKSECSFC